MPFINENLLFNPEALQQFRDIAYPLIRQAFRSPAMTLSLTSRTVNYEEDAYLCCIETPHLEVREYTFAFVHKGCVLIINADRKRENTTNHSDKDILEVPVHWTLTGISKADCLTDRVHTLRLIKEAFIKFQGGGGRLS